MDGRGMAVVRPCRAHPSMLVPSRHVGDAGAVVPFGGRACPLDRRAGRSLLDVFEERHPEEEGDEGHREAVEADDRRPRAERREQEEQRPDHQRREEGDEDDRPCQEHEWAHGEEHGDIVSSPTREVKGAPARYGRVWARRGRERIVDDRARATIHDMHAGTPRARVDPLVAHWERLASSTTRHALTAVTGTGRLVVGDPLAGDGVILCADVSHVEVDAFVDGERVAAVAVTAFDGTVGSWRLLGVARIAGGHVGVWWDGQVVSGEYDEVMRGVGWDWGWMAGDEPVVAVSIERGHYPIIGDGRHVVVLVDAPVITRWRLPVLHRPRALAGASA